MSLARRLRPILLDPDEYGQAGPPDHFKATTREQFGKDLERGACLSLSCADLELLSEILDLDETEVAAGLIVSTCYHEAGHAVAAAAGFCDTIPSEVIVRGSPDAEKQLGLVASEGRAYWMLKPWQLTHEAVQTMAAPVVEAYLTRSATVHAYGGDADLLDELEDYGAAPRAVVERMAWALVLAEWERVTRLAVALARAALESPVEDRTLVGRLPWARVLEVLEVRGSGPVPRPPYRGRRR